MPGDSEFKVEEYVHNIIILNLMSLDLATF